MVKVATAALTSCFGCHMSILDIDERLLDLIELVQFDKSPIDDKKEFSGLVDVGIIEGGVSNDENLEVARDFRKHCKILISLGECAIQGNIPAYRNMVPLKECLEEAYFNGPTVVNPSGSISIRVSGAVLPQLGADAGGEWTLDPTTFGYTGMVLSQEGFPTAGVLRVRDVEPEAGQWRIGGAADDTNHTRVIDLVLDGDQAAVLSTYPSSQESVGKLSPDDFAQIPLLLVEQNDG